MNIFKLGKQPPRIDSRTLKFAKYREGLPSIDPPEIVDWIPSGTIWPMMLNDNLGDCTIAAAGHMIEQWSKLASGVGTILPDSDILKAYEDVGGYVPGDPSTDNGCVMLDVLNYWRKTGIGGHHITAYVKINRRDQQEVKEALYLFGNVYTGIALPLSAQGADEWQVVPGPGDQPGSWGGHSIPALTYTALARTVVTWWELLPMTPQFWADYVDEAYAVVSLEWIAKNGLSPSHFNLGQLMADLEAVTA